MSNKGKAGDAALRCNRSILRAQPDVCDATLTQTVHTASSTRESTDVSCGPYTTRCERQTSSTGEQSSVSLCLLSFFSNVQRRRTSRRRKEKSQGNFCKMKKVLTCTRPVLLIVSGLRLGFRTLKNMSQSSAHSYVQDV